MWSLKLILKLPIVIWFCLGLANSQTPQAYFWKSSVYRALFKVTEYIKRNGDRLNIDGLAGIAMGLAALKPLVVPSNPQLININTDLSGVIMRNVPTLPVPEEKYLYFNNFFTNPSFWEDDITFQNRQLDGMHSLHFPRNTPKTGTQFKKFIYSTKFNESFSDTCLLALIKSRGQGTYCKIPTDCTKQVILDPQLLPGYGVTHRALFLQIAKHLGCELDINGYRHLLRNYCGYIYWEAKMNEKLGFIAGLDDLLLEQTLICGFEGYAEFFQPTFIKAVLNMQSGTGCFSYRMRSRKNPNALGVGELLTNSGLLLGNSGFLSSSGFLGNSGLFGNPGFFKNSKESVNSGFYENSLKHPQTFQQTKSIGRRRKREANELEEGCRDHTTGLAVTVLSLYLRFLEEYEVVEHKPHPAIIKQDQGFMDSLFENIQYFLEVAENVYEGLIVTLKRFLGSETFKIINAFNK